MEKETIEKLKELKQLVDNNILTQEEFEHEKQQLLSTAPAVIEKAEVPVVKAEVIPHVRNKALQGTQRPPRTIHVPLIHRMLVMKQTTPEGVIKKCDNYILRCQIGTGIGGVLSAVFVYYCITGGFWAIFGAVFWALIPSIILFSVGPGGLSTYKELREKFVGMSQEEFDYVQEVIRNKRANEKEAVITFATDFAKGVDQYAQTYQQETGSNFYADMGAAIGRNLRRKNDDY